MPCLTLYVFLFSKSRVTIFALKNYEFLKLQMLQSRLKSERAEFDTSLMKQALHFQVRNVKIQNQTGAGSEIFLYIEKLFQIMI